jgi:hypothetical protein
MVSIFCFVVWTGAISNTFSAPHSVRESSPWESMLHRIRGAGSVMFTIDKSLVRNADTVECGMVRPQKQQRQREARL